MAEKDIERKLKKRVEALGCMCLKFESPGYTGVPDRIVLMPGGEAFFVELKAPGKMMRPLQRKRRYQLMKLGFPVLCIDRMPQIRPFITAALSWTPGELFPEGIGARIPDLEMATLPSDMEDFGETLEPIDPENLMEFYELENEDGGDAL